MSLSAPVAYQVIQRNGTVGDIAIRGVITETHDLEARFNGGAWATLDTGVQGTFTYTLSNQAQGQGTLEVRAKDETGFSASVANVGIGEVFVIAGQSNAVGQATNNQTYSHATLKAGLFGNDYQWHELYDPSDDPTGQLDSVSKSTSYGGSVWLPLSTAAMADLGLPVAFIPCAMEGTGIVAWQPGANHQNRATLYGSMVYRALQMSGGVRCVLFWQGELDALNAMSQADYLTNLTALADAIFGDLGVKLMPCKWQDTTITQAQEDAIKAAIVDGWNAGGNILTGPDLSDMVADDGLHLQTDAKMTTAASRWWTAIKTAFGW